MAIEKKVFALRIQRPMKLPIDRAREGPFEVALKRLIARRLVDDVVVEGTSDGAVHQLQIDSRIDVCIADLPLEPSVELSLRYVLKRLLHVD